jgi:chromosome segregation ATPase
VQSQLLDHETLTNAISSNLVTTFEQRALQNLKRDQKGAGDLEIEQRYRVLSDEIPRLRVQLAMEDYRLKGVRDKADAYKSLSDKGLEDPALGGHTYNIEVQAERVEESGERNALLHRLTDIHGELEQLSAQTPENSGQRVRIQASADDLGKFLQGIDANDKKEAAQREFDRLDSELSFHSAHLVDLKARQRELDNGIQSLNSPPGESDELRHNADSTLSQVVNERQKSLDSVRQIHDSLVSLAKRIPKGSDLWNKIQVSVEKAETTVSYAGHDPV